MFRLVIADPRRFTSGLLAALCLLGGQATPAAAQIPAAGEARSTPAGATLPQRPAVRLGVDMLEVEGFASLRGKRIGLITNPTGVTGDLRSTADVLFAAPSVQLVALYGPEHGVRGAAAAGDKVADERDAATGLPVFSLYGKTRKPTPEMLADVDLLVYDVQDIGSRSYTYISTLALAMETAAECGKAVIVLDRPNPLGGQRVEGPVLDPRVRSFVGQLEVPYLHGMTVGELAQMINGEGWLGNMNAAPPEERGGDARGGAERKRLRCELQVVKMAGWKRDMLWADTGLVWTPTSPHIPHAESAFYYAATGILGEMPALSVGVGYPLPFELLGHPQIDGRSLAAELNGRRLPGVFFRPAFYTPFYSRFSGKTCGGVQVILTDARQAVLTEIQFEALDAVRRLYPDIRVFNEKADRDAMFDKVCGGSTIRELFVSGAPLERVRAAWRAGVDEFRARRAPYLLYP